MKELVEYHKPRNLASVTERINSLFRNQFFPKQHSEVIAAVRRWDNGAPADYRDDYYPNHDGILFHARWPDLVDSIVPRHEPADRFASLPEPVDQRHPFRWKWETILDASIPSTELSNAIKKPVRRFMEQMAERFYAQQKIDGVNGSVHWYDNPCAAIRGANGYGSFADRHYRQLKPALAAVCACKDSLKTAEKKLLTRFEHTTARHSPDLDIIFYATQPTLEADFIREGWLRSREGVLTQGNNLNETGEMVRAGLNFEVIQEHREGRFYRGWRMIEIKPDSGVSVFTIEVGLFKAKSGDRFADESDLELLEAEFAVGFNAEPSQWTPQTRAIDRRGSGYDYDQSDRRYTSLVSVPDNCLRLFVSSRTQSGVDLTVEPARFLWQSYKYGRYRLFICDVGIFDPRFRDRLPEALVRSLHQLSLRVGFFDIPSPVATLAQEAVNEKLWEKISAAAWSNYLFYYFLDAAHVSPLMVGTMLVENSRLDNLPDHLKLKIAENGVPDFTLSLGNMWPDIFGKMTDEQITRFLAALPNQDEYLRDYRVDTPDTLIHQGLAHLMRALSTAGVAFPDFGGNVFLQAAHVFGHPHGNS